jgi:hypothetical protein
MHAQKGSTSTGRSQQQVLGLRKIIAFYGVYPNLEVQTPARGGDWEYSMRGVAGSQD